MDTPPPKTTSTTTVSWKDLSTLKDTLTVNSLFYTIAIFISEPSTSQTLLLQMVLVSGKKSGLSAHHIYRHHGN
eukprot:3072603-Ditylum_brightwellii.AAC.1